MISEAQCVDSALRKKYSTKWQHSAVSTGQPQRRHPPCHLTLVKRCRVTGRASQSTRSRPWCSTLVYRWVTLHGTAPVLAQAWQRRACGMLCDWLNHGLLTAHANANHVGRPGHLGAMKVPGTAELFFVWTTTTPSFSWPPRLFASSFSFFGHFDGAKSLTFSTQCCRGNNHLTRIVHLPRQDAMEEQRNNHNGTAHLS